MSGVPATPLPGRACDGQCPVQLTAGHARGARALSGHAGVLSGCIAGVCSAWLMWRCYSQPASAVPLSPPHLPAHSEVGGQPGLQGTSPTLPSALLLRVLTPPCAAAVSIKQAPGRCPGWHGSLSLAPQADPVPSSACSVVSPQLRLDNTFGRALSSVIPRDRHGDPHPHHPTTRPVFLA